MKTLKNFIATTIVAGALVAQAQPAHAQYGQYGQYNGYGDNKPEEGNNIFIDKQVAEPGTATTKNGVQAGVYRDNLSINGTRYQPGQEVVFKIIVKNISDKTLTNITVTDRLPDFGDPLVGPGSYNSDNRTITYVINELKPNQEDVQYVRMQIYSQGKLPANQGITSQINNAEVTVGDKKDQDSAQYFIEKQVINITEVPKTGPELGLAFLALQGIGLAVGLKLRSHSA